MKKAGLIFVLMLMNNILFAQEKAIDTVKVKKKWDVNLDIASRYIWRGQSGWQISCSTIVWEL